MIGYKLTIEQKEIIHEVLFADAQAFNCVQDINDEWFTFISDQQKPFIVGTQFEWILNCEQVEYVAPVIDWTIFE